MAPHEEVAAIVRLEAEERADLIVPIDVGCGRCPGRGWEAEIRNGQGFPWELTFVFRELQRRF